MAYEKKTWKNRQSEYPNRRTLTPVEGQANTYDVARAEGLVMEDGDAFDQTAMNDLEERIGVGFVSSGVNVYTHTKSGTVHEFTGAGANGRALMTADVQAGDTFTVNGAPVTAYMGTDDAAGSMAGSAWNGKWVSFIVEGGTLNFKGGGGKVTVTGLTADAVKKGAMVTVKQGAKTVASVAGSFNPFVGDYGQVLLMWCGSNAGGYQPSAGSITYSVFPKSSKAVPKSPINGNSGTITIPGATFPPGEYTVISSGGSNNKQNNLLLTETSGRIATVKQHGMNTAKINVSSQQWIGFCNLTDGTGAGGVIIVRNS